MPETPRKHAISGSLRRPREVRFRGLPRTSNHPILGVSGTRSASPAPRHFGPQMDRFGGRKQPVFGVSSGLYGPALGSSETPFRAPERPAKHRFSGSRTALCGAVSGVFGPFQRALRGLREPPKTRQTALEGTVLGSRRVNNITRPTFPVFLDFSPADRVSRARMPRGMDACTS